MCSLRLRQRSRGLVGTGKKIAVDYAVLMALHALLVDPEIIDPRARMLATQAVKTIVAKATPKGVRRG